MLNIHGDYHSHTQYSGGIFDSKRHATGTIRDNVEAAYNKRLKIIGITDHGPSHYLYGVNKNNLDKMRDEVDRLNEEFGPKGLKILLGLEANFTGHDGTLDVDDTIINKLDLVNMGYHYGAFPKDFSNGVSLYIMNPIAKFFKLGRAKVLELNTSAYIKALQKYPIFMITHPGSKIKIDVVEVAKEARKHNTFLEISCKHGDLSVEALRLLEKTDVDFLINSDAHRPEDIGNLDKGIKRAIESGIDFSRIKNIEIIEGGA